MIVDPPAVLTYSSYLALDDVLDAQHPNSEQHDEMLFIVVHQVYELWFKQLLHEFAKFQQDLTEGHTANAMQAATRAVKILKVAISQVDILETMTPRQFTAFRDGLGSGSGFQSAQFREIEATLGRRDAKMYSHYPAGSRERDRVERAMNRPSVFDSLLTYLFIRGYGVPHAALNRDLSTPWEPSEEVQAVLAKVYEDDSGAAHICERLVDIDEAVQEWRYRHVKMVERIIGVRHGTGGSSGAAYLRGTLFTPLFPDLWAARGLM
ncbi:tryptophan 2,3-dioxygenase [Sphaerisporangium krabiense]|uniref:Tryptophan 2,3-dioxygenase n=1 Tax=Sphaerisporangium krabiense TaxID=763782 RepID=A0A7W9DSX7_9ACTN|nr:tryptophan 2,3-dioxygenase family protein [Sphaerisporangium krabiense]MBB5630202.1 tryptophan 2,3-dioxygenase [Sphaerisporangium krabiense]GII67496.1 tryptophan 2,3-dioxygenase [Sphaerisporangium krabiense]